MSAPASPTEILSAIRNGESARARDLVDQLPEPLRASGQAHFLRGLCDLAEVRPDKALHWLRRAAEASGPAPEGLIPNLVKALKAVAETSQATAAYDLYAEALALAPDDAEAVLGLAQCCQELCDFEDAATLYAALCDQPDAPATALIGYGFCLQELGRVDEANRIFTRAVARDPAARPLVAAAMTTARCGSVSLTRYGLEAFNPS